MKKEKQQRISINALEKAASEQFVSTVTEQWFDIDVTIKKVLPLEEMMAFVQEIVEMCFATDGTFIPEVMDFAIKSGIMTHYANFTLPDNLVKRYDLVYSTTAVDMICQHINMVQLQEIVNAANRKIDHMCDADIVATKAKLNELHSAFVKMGDEFASLFNGVDADGLQRLVGAIGDNGVDEEKIVSAYLNQTKKDTGDTDDK